MWTEFWKLKLKVYHGALVKKEMSLIFFDNFNNWQKIGNATVDCFQKSDENFQLK